MRGADAAGLDFEANMSGYRRRKLDAMTNRRGRIEMLGAEMLLRYSLACLTVEPIGMSRIGNRL